MDDLFYQVKRELIGLIAADADSGELWLDLHDGGQVSGADRRSRHQRGGVGGVLHYRDITLKQLSGLRTRGADIEKGEGPC